MAQLNNIEELYMSKPRRYKKAHNTQFITFVNISLCQPTVVRYKKIAYTRKIMQAYAARHSRNNTPKLANSTNQTTAYI